MTGNAQCWCAFQNAKLCPAELEPQAVSFGDGAGRQVQGGGRRKGNSRGGGGGRQSGGSSVSGKQLSKAVRRSLEQGDVDSALLAYLSLARAGAAPPELSSALLLGLVRAGRLGDAPSVTDALRAQNALLPLGDYASMLGDLPQRTPCDVALAFADACEPCVAFPDGPGHSYFRHFARLLLQEYLADAASALERIASRPPESLQSAGLALLPVRATALPKGGQLALSALQPGMDLVARARDGFKSSDTVLLTPLQGGTAHEAEVVTVFPSVTVKLLGTAFAGGSPASVALCAPGVALRVDKLANRVTVLRQLDALRCFAEGALAGGSRGPSCDEELRNIVVGVGGTATVPAMCDAEPRLGSFGGQTSHRQAMALTQVDTMSGLNSSQRGALAAGLTRTLTLIQGPPGTGKTATACALVRLWLASGHGPVLATSDSNVAVDNLVAGLARAGCRVVRVGRPESVRPDLLPYSLEHASGAVPLPGSAGAGMPPLPREEAFRRQMSCLKGAEVVCATCSGAGSDQLERMTFPSVLIDEAAQATEPSVLVPLCRGARRVVLVGDPQQLPPTVISREAESAGLGVSLFERLARCGVQPLLLDTQYRMHPALALFPSTTFYAGALRSGVRAALRPPPRGFLWPSPCVPVAFLPVNGAERAEGTSHTNAAEAEAVLAVVHQLLSAGELRLSDIAVVTPYAAQVRVLRRVLAPLRTMGGASGPGLEVASVDGFQGREVDVVVFSAVRASVSGGVGFLADARRLNVMLTRARRGLIVCGAWRTLAAERTLWGPWLDMCASAGLIVGHPAQDPTAAATLAGVDACPRALAEIGDHGGVRQAAEPERRREPEPHRHRSRSREHKRHRSRSRSREPKRHKEHRHRERSRERSRSRERYDTHRASQRRDATTTEGHRAV